MGATRQIKDGRKLGIWYSEDAVFDYGIAKYIGTSSLVVYFALCRHADRNGKAFPSVGLLTQECAMSNRLIAKSTRILKQVGLIEIERHKHQHNIYYVKSIKEAISLNGWTKIVNEKSPHAPKLVKNRHLAHDESSPGLMTNRHLAHDESSPGLMTNRHLAHDESSHKGLTTQGVTIEGHTEAHTHPDPGTMSENAKKNVPVCASLNDFEKRAWEWSQSHDFWKGRITNVEQLRLNLVEKKPFRVQFDQANTPIQPTAPKSQLSSETPKIRPNPPRENPLPNGNQEKLIQLKKDFSEERRRRVEEIMAGWDENTWESELSEFESTMNRVTRAQYTKQGLNSKLVNSALTNYVADKHLTPTENHFVTWAKEKGHIIEGDERNGYRLCSTQIGNVLEKVMPKMDN
jgi:hypothetical protein